ncbi:MAG: serine/threonine-protein kinase [Fuerstiella sp.]
MKLTNWQLHEPILLAFEDAWATGQVPQVDAFLHPTAEEPHLELLAELVMIDFEHRCQRSMATNLDEYLSRFPNLKSDPEILNELIQHEFRLRRKFGSYPTQAEIDSRFGADSTARQIWHRMSDSNGQQANAAAQLPSGTRINSYVIENVVGTGAFATVYSATDSRLNRKVAIKLLTQSSDLRPELRQRLQREAQAVASISHPNIVPVFESGMFGDHAYIVTRLVHGETLAQHLRNHTLTARQSVELVCQLAAALSEMHRLGVIHRDIKPANIMLENGIPQLLDFGLAAMTDASQQLTHDGDIVGTPAFMPPEQADGRAGHSDARSDIYSLGAVLYRLVCGCLPFEGNTSEVISRVLHQEARISTATTQQIGKDLHTIILKCLQKNPADRYQTANDLDQDLRRYLNGTPIHARPIGLMTQLGKWCRRRPALATMSAIAFIAVCVLVAVSGRVGHILQQRDSAQQTTLQTQQQLAASAAEAGLLALQRGQVEMRLSAFNRVSGRGTENVFLSC